MTNYYIILDKPLIENINDRQWWRWNILKYVESNLFVAYWMEDALLNKFQQMDMFDIKLFKILLEEWDNIYFMQI